MPGTLGGDHAPQPVGWRDAVGVQEGNDLAACEGDAQVAGRAGVHPLVVVNEVGLGEFLENDVGRAIIGAVYDDHFVGFVKVLVQD